jgi:hypothetical protein
MPRHSRRRDGRLSRVGEWRSRDLATKRLELPRVLHKFIDSYERFFKGRYVLLPDLLLA